MAEDPCMAFDSASDGVPLAAIFARVFLITRYLLFVSRILFRNSVSWATVMPLNCATIRFLASARSFFRALSSSSFLLLGFMCPQFHGETISRPERQDPRQC